MSQARPGAWWRQARNDLDLPRQTVRLVVNSFLAQGGDGFTGLRKGRDPVGGPLDVEALAAFLQGNPAPDPRPRVALLP